MNGHRQLTSRFHINTIDICICRHKTHIDKYAWTNWARLMRRALFLPHIVTHTHIVWIAANGKCELRSFVQLTRWHHRAHTSRFAYEPVMLYAWFAMDDSHPNTIGTDTERRKSTQHSVSHTHMHVTRRSLCCFVTLDSWQIVVKMDGRHILSGIYNKCCASVCASGCFAGAHYKSLEICFLVCKLRRVSDLEMSRVCVGTVMDILWIAVCREALKLNRKESNKNDRLMFLVSAMFLVHFFFHFYSSFCCCFCVVVVIG